MHSQAKVRESPARLSPAPKHWAPACTHRECTLHQLSPFIGKLKSSIARDLIVDYSRPGDLVVDMFCGSGTIPLEAATLQRRVFAKDASLYALTLTRAKLMAPLHLSEAEAQLTKALALAARLPSPDLRRIPKWVRAFYHPRTLKETLQLFEVIQNERNDFLLACLLGILHHQRAGFLSYPSSHLVPYLRSKKYPIEEYPQLYEYRAVGPRLKAKVQRSLRRPPKHAILPLVTGVLHSGAELNNLPEDIDCVITSPPYMNALDYTRDNRLRLWFLGTDVTRPPDRLANSRDQFLLLMRHVASELQKKVRTGGNCVFIVGERTRRGIASYPSDLLLGAFREYAPNLVLEEVIADTIPDIRRSRRHAAGVKRENILVFKKR